MINIKIKKGEELSVSIMGNYKELIAEITTMFEREEWTKQLFQDAINIHTEFKKDQADKARQAKNN